MVSPLGDRIKTCDSITLLLSLLQRLSFEARGTRFYTTSTNITYTYTAKNPRERFRPFWETGRYGAVYGPVSGWSWPRVAFSLCFRPVSALTSYSLCTAVIFKPVSACTFKTCIQPVLKSPREQLFVHGNGMELAGKGDCWCILLFLCVKNSLW